MSTPVPVMVDLYGILSDNLRMRKGEPVGPSLAPTETPSAPPSKFVTRFWARVNQSAGANACWPWIKSKRGSNGYGAVYFRRKYLSAHRVVWVITIGRIPDGLHVLHRCDTPICCNPAHLFLGTHLDNMRDMTLKNRFIRPPPKPTGIANNMSKLTPTQVLKIRERAAYGETHARIARDYGVSRRCVGHIIRRDTWGHLA